MVPLEVRLAIVESGVEAFWAAAWGVGQGLLPVLHNFLLLSGVGVAVSLRCRQERPAQQFHTCHLVVVWEEGVAVL